MPEAGTQRQAVSKACNGWKTSCWLRPINEALCPTCIFQRDKDMLYDFVTSISIYSEEDIYDTISCGWVGNTLKLYNLEKYLEDILVEIYKKSKPLLRRCIVLIHRTPLKTLLLHSIKNHTSRNICFVYGWMLRNALYEDNVIPDTCMRCISYTISHNSNWHLREVQIKLWIDTEKLKDIIGSSILKWGIKDCCSIIYSLLESSNIIYKTQCMNTVMKCILDFLDKNSRYDLYIFIREINKHPFLIESLLKSNDINKYNYMLKNRINPWKEELIAKSWHPSRFQAYCLDLDEQKSMIKDGLIYEEPVLKGLRASWDIYWN